MDRIASFPKPARILSSRSVRQDLPDVSGFSRVLPLKILLTSESVLRLSVRRFHRNDVRVRRVTGGVEGSDAITITRVWR
jgi:hypothetical protein